MTTDNTPKLCDLCDGHSAVRLGSPLGTKRGAVVYWCPECGLLQSFYDGLVRERHEPTISSDANWGNIRHGKGVRVAALSSHLEQLVPETGKLRVLDVGSNRGDVCNWLITRNPHIEVVAIEPDTSITYPYSNCPQVTLIHARLENISTAELGTFDLIVNLHTLEHATSASAMVRSCIEMLTDNGQLLIEVPNLQVIRADDIVEEFFIDKHSFHFDIHSLTNLLERFDLQFEFLDSTNDLNLAVVCSRKSSVAVTTTQSKQFLKWKTFQPFHSNDFDSYQALLVRNRNKLNSLANRLNDLSHRQSVALWGATRIFDALVIHGGLNVGAFTVIDDFLFGRVDSVHGVRLTPSSSLSSLSVDVLIVLARSSELNIKQKALSLGLTNIYTFRELFADS